MQTLINRLRELAGESRKICVAFSGGVDSALLVKLCCDAGLAVHAVTFDSTLQPLGEAAQAAQRAAGYGALHRVLWVDPLTDTEVRQNRRTRCYRCKYILFDALRSYAQAQPIAAVIDGTNADDLSEFRPGLRALSELGIVSPLAELGLRKAQVRELAARVGLDVANKPSSPCLATRFPYDTPLTEQALAQAGAAEAALRRLGFAVVRARVHGGLVRIEVPTDRLSALAALAAEVSGTLRALGYEQVTLDLTGFRSGSYDHAPDEGDKNGA